MAECAVSKSPAATNVSTGGDVTPHIGHRKDWMDPFLWTHNEPNQADVTEVWRTEHSTAGL